MATVYVQSNDPLFQGAESSVCRTGAIISTSDTVDIAVHPKSVVAATAGTLVVLPLKNSDGANASGILTFTGQPANTQTVTINSKVYTFQTVLTNVDGNVFIGATAAISLANLFAALTLSAAGSGSAYAAATTAHTTVAGTSVAGLKLTATSLLNGTAANAYASTTTVTGASWSAATLLGGVAGVYVTFGSVLAGYVVPFRVRRVNATGTSATCYALYD
jgi:hypothetical protein